MDRGWFQGISSLHEHRLIIDLLQTKDPFVNITQPTGPLNAYQRRLIYQLVRSEFPELRAIAKNDGHFMQVEKLNIENEERVCLEGFLYLEKFQFSISAFICIHLAPAIQITSLDEQNDTVFKWIQPSFLFATYLSTY